MSLFVELLSLFLLFCYSIPKMWVGCQGEKASSVTSRESCVLSQKNKKLQQLHVLHVSILREGFSGKTKTVSRYPIILMSCLERISVFFLFYQYKLLCLYVLFIGSHSAQINTTPAPFRVPGNLILAC